MFERVRRARRDEGLSIRAFADRHEVHRRTVRQALADATPPPPRTVPVRNSPMLRAQLAESTMRGPVGPAAAATCNQRVQNPGSRRTRPHPESPDPAGHCVDTLKIGRQAAGRTPIVRRRLA